LFNDNTFGIESLIQGVKSFEYRADEYYDETRMLDFDFYKISLGKWDLFLMKEELINKTYKKDLSPELVNNYVCKNFKEYNGSFNKHIW
jgi:hypothetical protein